MAVSVLQVGYKAAKGHSRVQCEDSWSLFQPKSRWQMLQYGSVFVVADGVGGKPLAAEASLRATKTIVERYYKAASPRVTLRLLGALRDAHVEIVRASQEKRLREAMNSTAVAAVVRDARVWVANVGNSRCYLVHRNKARLLSRDHTFIAEGVRRKIFSKAEAARHPLRLYLTQALGSRVLPSPSLGKAKLGKGDALLLCTDGLSDFISQSEIARALTALPPQVAAQHLVSLAIRRGTQDDCTALVVKASPYALNAHPSARTASGASARAGADISVFLSGFLVSLSVIGVLVLALLARG